MRGDSWRRDSGDICASCCSAVVETVKVNYSINGGALQAVVADYASIIPHAATRRGTAATVKTRRWFNYLNHSSMWVRLADDWFCLANTPYLHSSLHLSSERPVAPDPAPHPTATISDNICLILLPSTADWNLRDWPPRQHAGALCLAKRAPRSCRPSPTAIPRLSNKSKSPENLVNEGRVDHSSPLCSSGK